MSFKPVQVIIFPRKHTKASHPVLLFKNNPVKESSSQKHLGMILDSKLNFEEYFRTIFKINKTSIGSLHELQKTLSRQSWLTTQKAFIKTHFEYREALFDQNYNDSFHQKLKRFQYNPVLAITTVILGILTLFRMSLFWAAHWWGKGKKAPLPKICRKYSTITKLGTVIPYPKKVQKIYESRDTQLEFCCYQHLFTENQQILLYQEIQI